MARVKRGMMTRKRHNRVLKAAEGYYGARRRQFKQAKEAVMHAGQYALYPHFRSDGWIYFLVRDNNTHKEYVAATDAAIKMAAE